MKTYKKRCLIVVILTTMSFSIQACSNVNKPVLQNTENTTIEKTEMNDTEEIKSETNNPTENETSSNSEYGFNSSKTITENIDILNRILETKLGKHFSLSTIEDYEKIGQSDWTLILGNNKVGIDTATWKYDYDSDSDESKYMDAVLITFIFFYGEEMGNSLWFLTGDLLDGGADESLYGFTHDGGRAIYKNGDSATYEPGNNDNLYIWLTPEGLANTPDGFINIYFSGIGDFSDGPTILLTEKQQQEILTMLESVEQIPVDSGRDKSAYPTTVQIYLPGADSALYCIWSDGTFQIAEDTLGRSAELLDYISTLILERTGTDLLGYNPTAIHSLTLAELTFFQETSANDQSNIPFTQRITDQSALTQIEKLFQDARPMQGVSACSFDFMLTLTCADGSSFQYQIASDSCAVAISENGVCVEYGIRNSNGNDRSSFEKIFDLITWQ